MPFNSVRKRMGLVVLTLDGSQRLVEKGASELILQTCSHYHSFLEGRVPINESYLKQINHAIVHLANQALRTIALAYKDLPEGQPVGLQDNKGVYEVEKSGLTLLLIMGIKDILREEVP